MKEIVGVFVRRIMKKSLLISVFLGLSYAQAEQSAIHRAQLPEDVQITTTQKSAEVEPWIVVFVHGIMSIQPHVNAANFLRFMIDDVDKTTYSKTVELMRLDPIFYKNQAMQGVGLIKVDAHDRTPGNGASALANVLNRVTEQCYPTKKIDAHYYTFGWSGLLSVKQRYQDAKKLFIALEQEVAKFHAQGIYPKIKVIGYSHGGNVVLNLGAVADREFPHSKLSIDEAIFWGMPVQNETDEYVNSPIFKKIYHFYSTGDRVQKLDCFSFKRFFSRRVFKKRGKKLHALPKKLVQIQMKLTRNMVKTRKNPAYFEHTYDFTDVAVVSGKSHLLRDSSPGHAELWFFGWSPVHYRKTFALAPLPTIALVPFFMYILESIEPYTRPEDPIIIDVRPEHGLALIKNVKHKKFYSVVNFIQPDKFKELQELALVFKPENYDESCFKDHIYTAFKQAKKYYLDNWSKTPHRVRKRKLAKRKAEKEARQAEEAAAQCAASQTNLSLVK
jgi:hypothetical protein